jgi:hypothetical protein
LLSGTKKAEIALAVREAARAISRDLGASRTVSLAASV